MASEASGGGRKRRPGASVAAEAAVPAPEQWQELRLPASTMLFCGSRCCPEPPELPSLPEPPGAGEDFHLCLAGARAAASSNNNNSNNNNE
eukprot:CAMPEP_0115105050 /NCGR_PEP_ID=MMETSP0227-20121206/35727_1 /TAXON_ID=89957 /ORGANISM="Polarella glacialis, Strain CCMP 1383" /LENGTH=90 /DNA_ID=CAMNT_0002502179 /DNA_START=43 /DNA_END=312 /DNA_ORIENTATION=-